MLNRFDTFRLKSYNEKRRQIERYRKIARIKIKTQNKIEWNEKL